PRKNEEMRAALKRALALKDPATGLIDREAVARALVEQDKRGDVEAARHIFDRIDGKVPDRLEADVDARVGPALDEGTRLAILADAARRRGLARGAGGSGHLRLGPSRTRDPPPPPR